MWVQTPGAGGDPQSPGIGCWLCSECQSSSVEGWWPVCPFSPLGGRAGSHLPSSTVSSATGAAKEGIFPAGAAQGNVSISQHSLSPQDMAGGKLAWAKEWCKQEFVLGQRESVLKPFFLCGGYFFFCSVFPSQHIGTEWEIKATVSNMLTCRKVLKHPPASCTASTWRKCTQEWL